MNHTINECHSKHGYPSRYKKNNNYKNQDKGIHLYPSSKNQLFFLCHLYVRKCSLIINRKCVFARRNVPLLEKMQGMKKRA